MFEVHVLASGSDGNCSVVVCDDHAVMIDAGLSGKKIMELMNINGLDSSLIKALLVTHEHSDHVSGAGVMARKLNIPIQCNENTFISSNMGHVTYSKITTMETFESGPIHITPLPTSHNASEPNAFLLRMDGKKVLIATDTGKITPQIEREMQDVNIAVVESNHDKHMLATGPYPYMLKKLVGSEIGHLSNVACAESLKRTMNEKRKIFLAHLSKNNNTPDTARETVSEITGIKRSKIDCLEFRGDTRILKV
ncbi:MAG: MBL fold metallo-hydrolase [Methanomassiliicoccaceae archaeon]|jgi:phosphoribosyl 1,2-cyclic phosphodiesterase|nr:MBL fold metallo-hydrolase [Methanomassiliicoccaceae archaeon]